MLDRDGFRPNVGIILLNQKNQVFWGKRIRTHSWQFPQGGIDRGETPEQAMFRELHEEVGLLPNHVRLVARTRDWLRYEVPDRYIRRDARGHYKGQKQIWYLLQLVGHDWDLNLRATNHPEFDAWRWNDYWVPLDAVIEFKRGVYEMALTELARYLPRRDGRSGGVRYLRQPVRDMDADAQHSPPADLGYGRADLALDSAPAPLLSATDTAPAPLTSPYRRPAQFAAGGAGLRGGERRGGAERGRSMLLSGLHLELPPDASFDPDSQVG